MTSFSIVTVVYNDISHIIETMNSVIEQNYKQVEYILIDGGSIDGTKEKIFNHISSCANITVENNRKEQYYLEAVHKNFPEFTFKFLSEKDQGIYDAMNKGIILATREWINFMNCGDKFYNSEILNKIATQKLQNYDAVYGDTEIVYDNKFSKIVTKKTNPRYRMPFSHQSVFVKTQLQKYFPFDTTYKICSDNDFFTKIYNMNKSFYYLTLPISSCLSGGISTISTCQFLLEEYRIGKKYNKFFLFLFFPTILEELCKYFVKKFLPKNTLHFIQAKYNAK